MKGRKPQLHVEGSISPDEFWTPEELAERWRQTKRRILKRIRAGEIKALAGDPPVIHVSVIEEMERPFVAKPTPMVKPQRATKDHVGDLEADNLL